ncbi:methylated-DNA--[protein]-cysteine S-methyltransferase [Leucothrix sargassi]|nr:methylated-DNA--[protein]-cysteine S-methyltransferase [Leucothrix sargassi]
MTSIDYLDTPVGVIEIQASEHGICQVNFVESKQQRVRPSELTVPCKEQLREYFFEGRTLFDLVLDQQGTDFQMSIWNSLLAIPYGQSASYKNIADAVNNPKAVRAVGAANGRNPISIIVPCHRVIGSNGSLTGYAGGLDRKKWLLTHEGIPFH